MAARSACWCGACGRWEKDEIEPGFRAPLIWRATRTDSFRRNVIASRHFAGNSARCSAVNRGVGPAAFRLRKALTPFCAPSRPDCVARAASKPGPGAPPGVPRRVGPQTGSCWVPGRPPPPSAPAKPCLAGGPPGSGRRPALAHLPPDGSWWVGGRGPPTRALRSGRLGGSTRAWGFAPATTQARRATRGRKHRARS